MIKPQSLTQVYLYSTVLTVLFVFSLFGVLWIRYEVVQFQRESDDFRKEYLDSRKEFIKNEVENVVKYIDFERSKAEAGIKLNEKSIADEEEVIKKEILEHIEQFHFTEPGYLFGGTWNGISLFGPSKGQNM
ncbi:MAG: hypothetical protein KAR21_00720, partial [Spirochaetales bacterium]|nr:hypothetical protein [Spirochaetales bacterium]